MKYANCLAIILVFGGSVSTLAAQQPVTTSDSMTPAPTYRAIVISKSVKAVNYQHRSGATIIDLVGSGQQPVAEGRAKVRSKRGTLEVEAEFSNLHDPTTYGSEYLTYVMWAISPEGRTVNLGEVQVGTNSKSKLTATVQLQDFAVIVTAEPYFAVRRPSNLVVLENEVRKDSSESTETVETKYDLLARGGYFPQITSLTL